jgi:hypothetical protein
VASDDLQQDTDVGLRTVVEVLAIRNLHQNRPLDDGTPPGR